MQFTVNRKDFKQAVTFASKAISKRSTLPVLQNVLLELRGGVIEVTGTNLDVTAQCRVICDQNSDNAKITVPAKALADALAGGPDAVRAHATFPDKGAPKLTVNGVTLHGIDAAEFPPGGSWCASAYVTVPAATFQHALGQVAPFMHKDQSTPSLCGVNIKPDKRALRLAATDRHRLGLSTVECKPKLEVEYGITIPDTAVRVLRAAKFSTTDVDVYTTVPAASHPGGIAIVSHARFEGGASTVYVRLNLTSYPNVMQVVPELPMKSTIEVDRKELLEHAIEMSKFAGSGGVHPVEIWATKGELKLYVDIAETGDKVAKIPATINRAPSTRLAGVAASYLRDIVATLTGERITIGINEPLHPLAFHNVPMDGTQVVLMPVKVS